MLLFRGAKLEIVDRLRVDFPGIKFKSGKNYVWSPSVKTVFYDAQNPMKYVFKDNLATEITLKEDNTFKSPSIFGVIIILVLLVMALYAFWIGTDYLWCTFMN